MLVLPYIPPIPSVPRIEYLYRNRSEHYELSPPQGVNSSYVETYQITPCRLKILKTISWAEGTFKDGEIKYNIIFGGSTFNSYENHPRRLVRINNLQSDASGAYQFLSTTYDRVSKQLNLQDFSPHNQDQAALFLIDEIGLLGEIDKCQFNKSIISKLSPIWASFQYDSNGSYYGQPYKTFNETIDFFNNL